MGFSFLAVQNGLIPTIIVALTVIPYFLIPKQWKGKGVLVVAMISLLIANVSKSNTVYYWLMDNTSLRHADLYQLVVISGWMILKGISFAVDSQEENKNGLFGFGNFMGYVFYFPTLYLGPPIIYSRFRECYESEESVIDFISIGKQFLKDLCRVFLWFMVLELSNHFIYLSTVQYLLNILDRFNTLALFGYGYLMGQHFHVKYVVLYGYACALAKLDGIDTPPAPICVARVHKYSDTWKHFDRGLYEFLIK